MSEELSSDEDLEKILKMKTKDGTAFFVGGQEFNLESEYSGFVNWGQELEPRTPTEGIFIDLQSGSRDLIATLTNKLEIMTLKYKEALREIERMKTKTETEVENEAEFITNPTEIVSEENKEILAETNRLLVKKNLEHIENFEKLVVNHQSLIEEQQKIERETNEKIESFTNEISKLSNEIKDIEEARAIKVEIPDSWIIKD